jgi:hypothetical protein
MIQQLILRWLGLEEVDVRIRDLERHFVTKRDAEGNVTETLADVPVENRKDLKHSPRGMSWAQQRRWLEATDGGRRQA